MIDVTTFDGRQITLNAELIETVESVPETLISLTTGNGCWSRNRKRNQRLVLPTGGSYTNRRKTGLT